MEELVYTSAPQGLLPGTTGFCTVEMTDGTPTEIMESLESLSAYDKDPSGTVNWMHVRLQTVRMVRHVMSRVGPLQGEFSGRSNKLAHHICFPPGELPPQGPMQIIGRGGPLLKEWSGHVRKLPPQQTPSRMRAASLPRVCRSWASAAGDAGVAGAVLSKLRQCGTSPLWVIRTPAMDALAMTDELLAMLAGPQRWEVTFCTYLHSLPQSAQCRLRWVLDDSPAMTQLRHLGSDQLIDLRGDADAILRGADPSYVQAARNGTAIFEEISAPIRSHRPRASRSVSRPQASRTMDLSDEEFDSLAASANLPSPPAADVSPIRWGMIAAAIAILAVCLLILLAILRDPAPPAADRQTVADTSIDRGSRQSNLDSRSAFGSTEPEAQPIGQPMIAQEDDNDGPREVFVEPAERVSVPPARIQRTDSAATPAAKADPRPQRRADPIEETRVMALKLPSSALSLSLDTQTLFVGPGVNQVELRNVAKMFYPIRFQMMPPDPSGVSDLNAVAIATGEQRKLGAISIEPDRVLFGWSPDASAGVAASFILGHEFLIKNATHHTTIQLDLAQPMTIASPQIPGAKLEIPIPAWVLPEFECWAEPTVFSSVSRQGIQFKPFLIEPAVSRGDPPWHTMRQDISALEDPAISEAIVSLAGDITGSGAKRQARFFTRLELGGSGEPFPWSSRARVIGEQVEKYNSEVQNQNDTSGAKTMSSAGRKKNINQWGESLRCELKLYARVNGRDILWAVSGGTKE